MRNLGTGHLYKIGQYQSSNLRNINTGAILYLRKSGAGHLYKIG